MNSGYQFFLVLHHLIPFLKGNALISINVQATYYSNNFCFTGSETVHTTEIHDVVIVEDAFTSIVNCLERFHVRPINSPLQIVLDLFHVHVILDFVLEQECNLLFDRES